MIQSPLLQFQMLIGSAKLYFFSSHISAAVLAFYATFIRTYL